MASLSKEQLADLAAQHNGLWVSVTHSPVPEHMLPHNVIKRIKGTSDQDARETQIAGLQMAVRALRRAAGMPEVD